MLKNTLSRHKYTLFSRPGNRKAGRCLTLDYAATMAIQLLFPNLLRKDSAKASARATFRVIANVVEPLPDISVPRAPCSRKNSWNNERIGNLFNAGASREL